MILFGTKIILNIYREIKIYYQFVTNSTIFTYQFYLIKKFAYFPFSFLIWFLTSPKIISHFILPSTKLGQYLISLSPFIRTQLLNKICLVKIDFFKFIMHKITSHPLLFSHFLFFPTTLTFTPTTFSPRKKSKTKIHFILFHSISSQNFQFYFFLSHSSLKHKSNSNPFSYTVHNRLLFPYEFPS